MISQLVFSSPFPSFQRDKVQMNRILVSTSKPAHNLLGAMAYLKSQCKRNIRDGQKLLTELKIELLVKM